MEVQNYSGYTPQIQHSTILMELNYKEKHAAPQCTIFRVLTNNILIDTITIVCDKNLDYLANLNLKLK